jgi:predicted ATPase/DNA-binding SARP family transcriptional activator/DNA-binding CsgD family transcriptional regulator
MYPRADFEGVVSQASAVERPEAVRVRLLGGFRVSVGSRIVKGDAWRLRKAAGLVKLLALAPQHRLLRERAMELLWPGSARSTASNNLRGAIYAARKAIGAEGSDHLVFEDGALLLCPEGELWVDTEAFEEATLVARRLRNPASYRMAIDLYAGELLPDDRYEEWAEEGRADLRRLYLTLLTELATLYEEQGEYDPAAEALQRLLAEELADEEAHASLMRLYALSDRQGEALAQYERLREALSRRLDAQPAAETRQLRESIATGRFPSVLSVVPTPEVTTGAGNHNLPIPTTSLVDREREMAEVKRELAMTRLLTLTGPGGSGKTRLALEVGSDLIGAYPDGVWLVDLARLSEPGLVVQEVAGVLDAQERSGEPPLDTLIDELRSKQVLIILDNCEHLLDGVAHLVDILLRSCPNLRFLATSREALGVPGEISYPVLPLSLPDPGGLTTVEELESYGAARLFVERALYRSAAFALTPENAGAVAEICRQLEGIPLAIELAAARVGVLAVEQISERLSAALKILTGGGRTLTSRQRTLRGSLDWSYALLGAPEKRLLARLSVFAGGWTLEAAEVVCSGGDVDRDEVLDLLGDLVGKSLVVARTGANGAMRYRMLEIIRQYAAEKLAENGEAEETHGRHAAFFLALAEEARPELAGSQQGLWVERLEREQDNLRAALSWVIGREEGELGLRFGGALWRFWFNRGHLSEGTGWMGRVLAGGGPGATPIRVNALEGMGWLLQFQGELDRAETTYEEMLRLSRELGDMENAATGLNSLGILAVRRGDNGRARMLLEENLAVLRELEEASVTTILKRFYVFNLLGILAINEEEDHAKGETLWKESLALARSAGDTTLVRQTLVNLGHAALMQRAYERARAYCEAALTLARELGSAEGVENPTVFLNLGLASLGQREHERAAASFEESLAMSQKMRQTPSAIESLEGMAGLAGATIKDARAAILWGAAETAREVTGLALSSGEWALHEPYLAAARSRLGEAVWEEAVDEGRAMSLEEAAVYALEGETGGAGAAVPEGKPSAHDEPAGNLTRREEEVAVLVARGLTNRQISTELSISERTAGNHVARILRKLGLDSRTQIATWSAGHGLLGSEQD